MENSTDYMYNSLAFPQKDKNIRTVYFTSSTLGYTCQWTENSCSNNKWYTNIHSNIIHNSPKVEPIQLSISGWMNMQTRVHAKTSTIFCYTRGTVKWCSTLQDMTEIPQTPANGINIQYVNSNSGYVPKRFEKMGWKKINSYFYTRILANNWKESKCPWTDNSINKLRYTHNGIWFSL